MRATGKFRRWAGPAALVAGIVTSAGFGLVATPPAQASTASTASPAAGTVHPATAPGSPAGPAASTAAAQHYTAAGCNTQPAQADYASCFATVYTAVKDQIAASADGPPTAALGPSDIQSAYNLPSATAGTGQTVAIVDAYGDSDAESDLATFRSYYDLPPCTTANGCFTKVAQDGSTNYPPDDSGWGLETSLDLDAVSSACPNCHILLVEASDNSVANLSVAEDEAVSLGAKYVSNSYGATTDVTSSDSHYEHPGVAIVAATGDTGDVADWPATNPDVTAVGGTTLTRDTAVARGWDESAWSDGGSGCAQSEPQPGYQATISTDCPNHKAVADVSADADPSSGLATYDTLGEGGWLQVGGTSLATPLITAIYALAGPPAPGSYPVTYPYDDTSQASDLYDITSGSNGSCGDVLCTAGPGWDGPTGLGTPDGVSAFTYGPHGDIAGTVTSSSTGRPVAGATVTATAAGQPVTATTDSSGHYDLSLPVGSYSLTAAYFGYQTATTPSVAVSNGQTTTENIGLTAIPDQTLSGTVTDGTSAGWPLYAKITIAGYPGAAIYTNPFTGRYSVRLPQSATYSLTITPLYPGYLTRTVSVNVGTSATVADETALVDQSTCSAPGYAFQYAGITEDFTGWTGTTAQDGWTNVDNVGNGQTWSFSNPLGLSDPPGGSGVFAMVDSDDYGAGNHQDTSLVSPVVDLSGAVTPEISFDTDYDPWPGQEGNVDLSLDGGQTWSTVWSHSSGSEVETPQTIPIPQAAGQSDVRVRFHFTGTWGWYWKVDNVFIGQQSCVLGNSGLVAGVVTDANTRAPLDGAKVASVSDPAQAGVTAATADPAFPHGLYWLLSASGATQFTATDGKYTPATATVQVAAHAVTRHNFVLTAGRLALSVSKLSVREQLGAAQTKMIRLTNDGTQPLTVQLRETDSASEPLSAQASAASSPLEQIKGTFLPDAAVGAKSTGSIKNAASPKTNTSTKTPVPATAGPAAQPGPVSPADSPWEPITSYPTPIMDNAAAYDAATGDVYSIAGDYNNNAVASSYVYNPFTLAWSPIASAPQALENAAAASLGGDIYLVGGWDSAGNVSSAAYSYDPSSNTWSTVASMPAALSASSVAVLNGDLYVIGGCTTEDCSPTSADVFEYDPSGNDWTQLASYPVPVAFAACAGIDSELVCAGGIDPDSNTSYTSTYIYDPGSGSWSQGASMPYDDWGMAYAGSADQLQIAGGVIDNSSVVTNQAAEYDPSANSWSTLPNAGSAVYRGGSACGLYKIGGSAYAYSPQASAEVLPGYDQCGLTDVPWLTESRTQLTIAPRASATVALRLDARKVAQPGSYTVKLAVQTDTPYQVAPVSITLTVQPPRSWGKVAGTVTDASTGNPVPGATVQICTENFGSTGQCGPASTTVKTNGSGYYQLWLSSRYSPLKITVSGSGYQPMTKTVRIRQGATATTNFALAEDSP